MAKTTTQVKKLEVVKPTTQVAGKTVNVVGTQGGAISQAATQAKAAKLKGAAAPASAGKYTGGQTIKILPQEEGAGGNPHRAGTYRYKAYAAMEKCKTTGEYVLTGYKTKYLARWVKMGLIRVS